LRKQIQLQKSKHVYANQVLLKGIQRLESILRKQIQLQKTKHVYANQVLLKGMQKIGSAATKRLAGVACRNTMKSNDQYTKKNTRSQYLTKQLKTKQPPDAEALINKPSDSNGRWT
jgi:lactate dehydrogenase-like 2-hydroxyacid dehydrogenase